MKKLLMASTMMLALFLLCGDTCVYSPLLTTQAEENIAPARHWYLAARSGDTSAIRRLTDVALENNDTYWLTEASKFGDARASYGLAMIQESPLQQTKLLRQAAMAGHAEAQYELAMQSNDHQRLIWLQQAAEQGLKNAEVALAQWWSMAHDMPSALPWLIRAGAYHGPSAKTLGRYYWQNKQPGLAKKWLAQAQKLGNKDAAETLKLINQLSSSIRGYQVSREECAIQVQFVATSLATLQQTLTLQQAFAGDKRLSSLPICLNEPILEQDINCSQRWQGQPRLGCDLAPLAVGFRDKPESFTHLVIMADKGKANVHNGVMYLDLADSYSVFVHELAHFSGFVDEYPVSESLAEQFCHTWVKAPNLIYVEEEQEPDISDWLSLSETVQLSRARTCNNLNRGQMYKPSSSMTFLEYHDQQKIPAIYLRLWARQLKAPSTTVPAYLNLAEASEQAGLIEQTLFWQQQYLDFYPGTVSRDNNEPQALH